MTSKLHFRMTASELAMGRYMRAPDHPPADDAFSTAFDNLVIEDRAGAPAPAAETPGDAPPPPPAADPPAADPPAADPPAADPPAGDPPAAADPPAADPPAADPPAADPPAADPPAADPPAAADDAETVMRRLADHIREAAPPTEAPPADAQEPPIYTQAEMDTLTKFGEDWAEVNTALDLRERAFGRSLLKYSFQEVAKVLEPIQALVDGLAGRAHLGDIKDKVGDYSNDERQACLDWVEKQPDYLQTAYKGVIEDGTAGQVADLIGRFREATGRPAPAAAPVANQEPPGDTELSSEAKKAAAALAPVRSERSVVAEPNDASNFDQAWDRWSKPETAG